MIGSCADSDWHLNVQLNKCTGYVVYRSEEPSVYDVNDDFATNKNILHLGHACEFKASTTFYNHVICYEMARFDQEVTKVMTH